MEMMNEKDLNVLVLVNTDPTEPNGEVLSMTFTVLSENTTDSKNPISKTLYVERALLNLEEKLTSNPEFEDTYNALILKDKITTVLEDSDSYRNVHMHNVDGGEIFLYKASDSHIRNTIMEFLNDNRNPEGKIRFWVNNPVDWHYFTLIGFYWMNGRIEIPEYIDPYPIEINSVLGVIKNLIPEDRLSWVYDSLHAGIFLEMEHDKSLDNIINHASQIFPAVHYLSLVKRALDNDTDGKDIL